MAQIANIRDVLHPMIGQRIVDITQQDWDEVDYEQDCPQYIFIHMEDGSTLSIPACEYNTFVYDGAGPPQAESDSSSE